MNVKEFTSRVLGAIIDIGQTNHLSVRGESLVNVVIVRMCADRYSEQREEKLGERRKARKQVACESD